ncbi:hypothetical protein SAMN04488082_108120 [Desulfomicrobium apsheronum]|uniref:Uncharacterized protein n=1 Tax=Desulfomicrobium apsheronum TaxID=52560 RepID=A0A1I3UUI5_9BACT|nr:hypothetical protein [Desulfomicrobium apsheronum]SFJ86329.1 hypothetical protein SAMN04488082_108120 [Desulfomicrobium apsheronum]
MYLPSSLFVKAVLTIFLLLGFTTLAMATQGTLAITTQGTSDMTTQGNLSPSESALAAQAAAEKKATEIGKQALQAAEEAKKAKENNAIEIVAAYEAIAAAFSKAQQGYEQAAMLYGKAALAYASGNADAAGLDVLLAQSAESGSAKIFGQAYSSLILCQSGYYTKAIAAAKEADSMPSPVQANVVEGGEGEVGAGLEEQEGSSVMAGGSTITSPVMQASPSAFSGSGGRTTASGF